MKKALIITYYWPPSGGAGVQRWLKFVKYLRDYQWEPVIYTPENPEFPETDPSLLADVPRGIEIWRQPIREPYGAYKKLMGRKKEEKINAAFLSEKKNNRLLETISVWIRGNFFIPDARKFWIKPSIRFLKKQLQDHPVRVIISTGPPHSTHLIAMSLASELHIPWLADFRDPWTNIDFYKDLKLTRWADKKHHTLEKSVLEKANAITVISNTMAMDFRQIYPRDYEVITNGYDDADIDRGGPVQLDKKFSIAHIGTLVSARNPVTLWEALKQILQEDERFKNDLEIKLIGKVDYTVSDSLHKYGLGPFVSRTDYMPHSEVIKCQQESRILLLIINNTPNSKMILTGKFFEYLAASRPILCLGPETGDAAQILEETKSGLLAGFGDVETMKNNLLTFYLQYLSGNPVIRPQHIVKYSRKALTGDLALLLDRLSGGNH
ncbi:MAG: glycosyltransferase family 4 protein [Bacteroidales bacterium]|nr:glycosyltransferase family 4 protein [Bacteroidales bacterium]